MIAPNRERKTVVVIGNGMVGHRFCERLVEYDVDRSLQVVTFCEEPRPAYDRVNLTKYFEHRDAGHLQLARQEWYAENGIILHVGDRARRLTASAAWSFPIAGGRSRTTPSCWRPALLRLFRASRAWKKKESSSTALSKIWSGSLPTHRRQPARRCWAEACLGSRPPRPCATWASKRTSSSLRRGSCRGRLTKEGRGRCAKKSKVWA